MKISAANIRKVCDLEKKLLTHLTRHSENQLNELIDEGFIEIGKSGKVYDKTSAIQVLMLAPNEDVSEFSDLIAKQLSSDTVLVTYKTEGGKVTRSSIWLRENSKWKIVFHQASKFEK